MEQIYSMLGISAEVEAFGNAVLKDLKERFEKIDAVAEYNQAEGTVPMTFSSVSYGLPTGESSSSPGRRFALSAIASACVPQVI